MTVRELINELERFEDDVEVVTKSCNSFYVDNIGEVERQNINSFWGDDCEAVVLSAYDQIGSV